MPPDSNTIRVVLVFLVIWLLAACAKQEVGYSEMSLQFAGTEKCVSCHEDQRALWTDSHHALAMAHADDTTVLGDFSDSLYSYRDVQTRFFKRDGQYFVHTDGPDGELRDFEISYTFGIRPRRFRC